MFAKCIQELTGVVSDLAIAGSKGGQIANLLGDPKARCHYGLIGQSIFLAKILDVRPRDVGQRSRFSGAHLGAWEEVIRVLL